MPKPIAQPVQKPLPKPEEIKPPEPLKDEDEGKEMHKRKLTGYIARIFQHEYDHMEGIDFTERGVVEWKKKLQEKS